MGLVYIVVKPIITFALVASFSLFFMSLFVLAGMAANKWQRNVIERADEYRDLNGYLTASFGGLISGVISLIAMVSL